MMIIMIIMVIITLTNECKKKRNPVACFTYITHTKTNKNKDNKKAKKY